MGAQRPPLFLWRQCSNSPAIPAMSRSVLPMPNASFTTTRLSGLAPILHAKVCTSCTICLSKDFFKGKLHLWALFGFWASRDIYIYISFLAAIRCSDPDPIENGDVERKCQTFGCRISYKCRAGYELDGRQHRYCQADGSWSPRILPQCVRKWILVICGLKLPTYIYFFKLFFAAIQCEQPQNPLNGRAIYDSVSYNSLISYECNYGYMLIGDSVRRCERNKMWTGTEPTCKGKCCKWCTQHTKGLLSIHHHHEEALLLLLLVYTECKQRMGRLGVD